jgi:hypothetical protein
VGDLLIVEITDPTNATLAGERGVLDEFGLSFYLNARRGADARTLLHGVRANDAGTTESLSYWDAGVHRPRHLRPVESNVQGSHELPAGVEGNAHSVDIARNDSLLVAAAGSINGTVASMPLPYRIARWEDQGARRKGYLAHSRASDRGAGGARDAWWLSRFRIAIRSGTAAASIAASAGWIGSPDRFDPVPVRPAELIPSIRLCHLASPRARLSR